MLAAEVAGKRGVKTAQREAEEEGCANDLSCAFVCYRVVALGQPLVAAAV